MILESIEDLNVLLIISEILNGTSHLKESLNGFVVFFTRAVKNYISFTRRLKHTSFSSKDGHAIFTR